VLSRCGVDGPLTIKLPAGTYGVTKFPYIPGTSETNLVTFEPATATGQVTFRRPRQGVTTNEPMLLDMTEASGIRFIMIKATEGASRVDENFADNFHQAREYGFTRGAYHFYSVYSPAEKQARFFISHVKLENGDLPPVLDVEHKPKHQSDEEFAASILKWLDIVERHYGVKPIIYTYYKFKTRYLSDPVFDSYPYWIAHYYVDEVEYGGPWKFWQHTDAGRLPGIKGQVDFNIYNGSFYDLRKMTIGAREQIGEDAYAD
jgi:lysozyme